MGKRTLSALAPWVFALSFILITPDADASSRDKRNSRDPNASCLKCHDTEPMLGAHLAAKHPQTDKQLLCTDCHGKPGPSRVHRRGAPKVIKFGDFSSGPSPLAQQNETCFSCHQPDALREANWTHDVHAQDLSCTTCHDLHPEQDPMLGLEQERQVEMCVACHSDLSDFTTFEELKASFGADDNDEE